ncbi:MAG: L,D-transpeptidase [Candidatus Moduliflexus flocculans]|nr:L,D-transpeptidase [Candidatus Moduliflexus flocculans]
MQNKRIEVNLTTQTLTAYEFDKVVLKTLIASGIPNGRRDANGIPTKTPEGEFRIVDKMPAKHMGNGNLFADFSDYELPGFPGRYSLLRRDTPSMAPTGMKILAFP